MGVRPTTMEMRAMMPPVTTAMMVSRWPHHSPGGDNTGETMMMLIIEIISSVLSNIVEEDERDNSRDKVDDKKNNSSLTDQSDHSSSRLSRDGSGSRDNIVSVTDISRPKHGFLALSGRSALFVLLLLLLGLFLSGLLFPPGFQLPLSFFLLLALLVLI